MFDIGIEEGLQLLRIKSSKKGDSRPKGELEIKVIFQYTVAEKGLTLNGILRGPEKRWDYGGLKVLFSDD